MPPVALLSTGPWAASAGAVGPALAAALNAAGIRTRLYDKPRDLFTAPDLGDASLVVVESTEAGGVDRFLMTSFLHQVFSGDIVLCAGATAEQRAYGLGSGASYCLSSPASQPELIAVVRSLLRPTQNAAAALVEWQQRPAQEEGWLLDRRKGRLHSPGGPDIVLSAAERILLTQMFREPNRLIRRDQWQAGMARMGVQRNSRVLDVMICRIRRKGDEARIDVPIEVIRGVGYLFCAPCSIKGERIPANWDASGAGLAVFCRGDLHMAGPHRDRAAAKEPEAGHGDEQADDA